MIPNGKFLSYTSLIGWVYPPILGHSLCVVCAIKSAVLGNQKLISCFIQPTVADAGGVA